MPAGHVYVRHLSDPDGEDAVVRLPDVPAGRRPTSAAWPLLCAAGVVVTHAGQNAIADVATARSPAMIVPQPRLFDDQATTARALDAPASRS